MSEDVLEVVCALSAVGEVGVLRPLVPELSLARVMDALSGATEAGLIEWNACRELWVCTQAGHDAAGVPH